MVNYKKLNNKKYKYCIYFLFVLYMKVKVPLKYVPERLNMKDKKKVKQELKKSRAKYKKGIYYTRKKVKSYEVKPSKHVLNAQRIYNINSIDVSDELSKKTKCSKNSLLDIVKKGQGAYFSAGSRPNQTGHSWGIARLASAITGGKAAAVDYNILEKGCKSSSIALKLAKKSRKKHGFGKRKTRKILL